eukprot:2558120-Rhodomonas_salina.1
MEVACHALDIVNMDYDNNDDCADDVRIALMEQLVRNSNSAELLGICNAGDLWDKQTQSFSDVPWWWAIKAWLLCRQDSLQRVMNKCQA